VQVATHCIARAKLMQIIHYQIDGRKCGVIWTKLIVGQHAQILRKTLSSRGPKREAEHRLTHWKYPVDDSQIVFRKVSEIAL
jgi:hypothetical protein